MTSCLTKNNRRVDTKNDIVSFCAQSFLKETDKICICDKPWQRRGVQKPELQRCHLWKSPNLIMNKNFVIFLLWILLINLSIYNQLHAIFVFFQWNPLQTSFYRPKFYTFLSKNIIIWLMCFTFTANLKHNFVPCNIERDIY